MKPSTTWDQELVNRIAGEVRHLRDRKGISAQTLTDRINEIGLKMSRSTLAELENGRRSYVSVAELILFAHVLSTAPVALVYPGPYDQMVDVLPNVAERQFIAAQWFSGLLRRGPQDLTGELDFDLPHNLERLRLSRKIEELRQAAFDLVCIADELERSAPGDAGKADDAGRLRLQVANMAGEITRMAAEIQALWERDGR